MRSALLAAMLCGIAMLCGGDAVGAGNGGLVVQGVPQPDGSAAFIVTNTGTRKVDIAWGVDVEQVRGAHANALGLQQSMFAIERCDEARTQACRAVAPGQTLRLVPWTGWNANVQCPRETPSDFQAPTGRYRFVVELCGSGVRVKSAAFLHRAISL